MVPGLVGGCALAAALRAAYLYLARRDVYDALGAGPPSIIAQPVTRLNSLEV